ncbi:ABC transporter substrate-binding protein [Nonlabens sp. Asnod2-A12]|uniref:ABC transporter substrate-binding protein n=1 Tax=Nonlabens sp. Asnod2-A12 TaxID=3160578 RepID=UPI00386C20AB
MKKVHIYLILITAVLITACGGKEKEENSIDLTSASWEEIEKEAHGKTVNMMMWSGDPKINSYMKNYVAPAMKERYNIDVELSNGQGNAVVQLIMTEKQAGKKSNIDMMWINGETFYQLRQVKGLYGPFVDQLPNAQYIDLDNPFIGTDFQEPINGMETPWGNVQMTLIYNSDKVTDLPQSREDLLAFVKANPGKFTFDNHFTGLTFLKALLIDIAGGKDALAGDFNEEKYNKYSAQLWSYVKELQPYLWKNGEAFPQNVAQMHQLFASGELLFTMSNNDAEVDNKINEGVFAASSRAYVPEFGTIQNSHYLGIASDAVDKAAAMVMINFMISPEAQLKKQNPDVWGDGTVLKLDRLSQEFQEKFQNIPSRKQAPNRKDIQEKALQELAPEYMIRLAEDFRTEIINS